MIKVHFPLALVLALTAGGCAQATVRNTQALSAEAARYGVSRELLLGASDAGYLPERHDGKTFFCTEQAQTFSYIPRSRCLDTAHMTAMLQQSGWALRSLQRRTSTMPYISPEGH
ncbi:MAG: hypothetical protein ACRES6_07840 [Steroidobacteraceae bacterium]